MRLPLLSLVFSLLACASRESPSRVDAGTDTGVLVDAGDAGKPIPEGAVDALAANHRVFCRSFQKCFPVQFSTLWADEEGCVARRLKLSTSVLFGPGSLLTTADIEACGRVSGPEYSCDQILRTFYENPVIPADCRLKGTSDNGTPCAGSDQCKSGYCRYELTSACGSCSDRVGPGGACAMHQHCAEGFACHNTKCVPWVDRGGACDGSKPCHTADYCAPDGKCAPRLSLDSACDPAKQECEPTLSCSSVTSKCVPLTTHGLGEPCGFRGDGTLGLCNFGLKCKITNAGAYTGACVGAAKAGDSCFRTGPNGSQCEAPLLCASTCVLPSTDVCR